MKILITGATGFVGTHLQRSFVESGDEIELHGTTMSDPKRTESGVPPIQLHKLDLTDPAAVDSLLKELQPDQIYHLASIAFGGNSFDDPQEIMRNNVLLQTNLMDSIRRHTPKTRLLHISTAEVYGRTAESEPMLTETLVPRPTNPYGVSKASQEMLALAYHHTFQIDVVVARPFNHIGVGQHSLFVVPSFLSQLQAIKAGEQTEMRVGNLSTARDYSDVRDVVAGYRLLMEKGLAGECYNIASGSSVKTERLLELLAKEVGVEPKVVQDPSKMRPNEIMQIMGDSSKLRALGWTPSYSIEETIQKIVSGQA